MRRVAAQTWVEIVLTARRGEAMILTFGIPLAVLAIFGTTDLLPVQGRRADFLVPGVAALAIMSSAMVALGIATGFERSNGVLKLLGATPLSRAGLVASKAFTVLALEVVQVPLILLVGLGIGGDASPGLAAVAAMVLGTLAFSGIGMLLAGRLRAEANIAAVNGLYLLMLLIGGMAFDQGRLPGWLAFIGRHSPAGALADAARAGFAGVWDGGSFAVLIVWAVAAPVLAAASFRWE